MKEYTVILVYRQNYRQVLLQMKTRGPVFNIGKWNGIGGKLEHDELPMAGALRESGEEAGLLDSDFVMFEHLCSQELPVSSMTEEAAKLYVFYGLLKDGVDFKQTEDEKLTWFESDNLLRMYDLLAGFGNLMHWHDMVVSHYKGVNKWS